jgi:hypothetical protein
MTIAIATPRASEGAATAESCARAEVGAFTRASKQIASAMGSSDPESLTRRDARADRVESMVARGTLVTLAWMTAMAIGCPQPGDEVGDDEVGDAGEVGSASGSESDGEGGVEPGGDDLRAPDDSTPESESDESESDGNDDDESDDPTDTSADGDETDTGDTSECWDLDSADGILPILVEGNTLGASDDALGSCGQFAAPDFTFGFEAPFAGEFVFDTTGSSFDTVLYVQQGACGDELACNDDFIGLRSRLVLELDAGEQVSVVVDGIDGGAAGPFVLRIDEYVAPTCTATPIPGALPKVVLGNTLDALDEHAGGCGGAGSPDHLYRFVAPGPGLYRIHTLGSAFDTVLYAWSECDGPELACSDDANLELQSELFVELAAGQAIYVIVDGLAGAAGAYQLNVELAG